MAKSADNRRRKKNRAKVFWMRFVAVIIVAATAALVSIILAFVIEKTNSFGWADKYETKYVAPVIQLPSGAVVTVPVEREKPPAPAVDNSAWNFIGEVEKTINNVQPVITDARMICLPENTRADESYFTGVTFLGDSVTQGLNQTRVPGATVCAYKGISLKAIYDGSIVERADKVKEIPLEAVAASNPEKVYVLMGANSYLAYPQDEAFLAYYDEMIKKIQEAVGSEVLIYIQSITPVAKSETRFDMERIRRLNNEIALLARNNGVYYLDLQEALVDEEGYLKEEYAAKDGYHLQPAAYSVWVEYILTHTVKNIENPDI